MEPEPDAERTISHGGHPAQSRRPASRSPRALAKAAAKRTGDDLPAHSFQTLLADLATICLNQIQPAEPVLPAFQLITTPAPIQRQALDLLGVSHRHGIT
jgi:hypothetical protein